MVRGRALDYRHIAAGLQLSARLRALYLLRVAEKEKPSKHLAAKSESVEATTQP
jgi:hypothetical protein